MEDRRTHFRSRVTIEPGKPIRLDQVEASPPEVPADPRFESIGQTLKAYREAAIKLLSDKYPGLKDTAPPHMRGECDCLALICDDGVVIRWDPRAGGEKPKVRVGRLEGESNTVANVAPKVSAGLVHCAEDPETFSAPTDGPRLQFVKTTPAGEVTPVADHQLAIVIPAKALREVPAMRYPTPVVSVLNEFTVQLVGEELDADADPSEPGQPFVAVGRVKLSVGWEVFEVYPHLDAAVWDPDHAADRAEVDLLAIAAGRNVAEQRCATSIGAQHCGESSPCSSSSSGSCLKVRRRPCRLSSKRTRNCYDRAMRACGSVSRSAIESPTS